MYLIPNSLQPTEFKYKYAIFNRKDLKVFTLFIENQESGRGQRGKMKSVTEGTWEEGNKRSCKSNGRKNGECTVCQ